MTKISTGNDNFDRYIHGGIPASYISTIESSGNTNTIRFIHQIIESNSNSCVYISTEKQREILESEFSDSNIISDPPKVFDGPVSKRDPLDEIISDVRKLPSESILVIDSLLSIEEDSTDYVSFLSELKQFALDMNLAVFLLCDKTQQNTPQREHTYSFSDIVLRFNLVENTDSLETVLSVPKYRGEDTVTEKKKIEIKKSSVSLDNSRDIA